MHKPIFDLVTTHQHKLISLHVLFIRPKRNESLRAHGREIAWRGYCMGSMLLPREVARDGFMQACSGIIYTIDNDDAVNDSTSLSLNLKQKETHDTKVSSLQLFYLESNTSLYHPKLAKGFLFSRRKKSHTEKYKKAVKCRWANVKLGDKQIQFHTMR
ncbi:hypothetical protein CPB83DRAFT_855233 [Crepidotus variabilis]|uniref:Uncharacterized protein n=1 Tax=Crepidotus variabilis TaxID=179855 RepID=A0A9P6EFD9_9AGAR|nr:hypothetical protein CPB83DRAFT_855233 [Crepidotus variabilis]